MTRSRARWLVLAAVSLLALAGCGNTTASHGGQALAANHPGSTSSSPSTAPGAGTPGPTGTGGPNATGIAPGGSGGAAGPTGTAVAATATVGPGSTVTSSPGPQSTVPPTTSGPPPTSGPTTSTQAPPPPAGSGVFGTVTAGPTCPVERQDQPCPPRPVSADISAQDSSGATVGHTHSDGQGQYQMSLPPGTYTLTATTGNTFPRCSPTTATVTAGRATRADIDCDTGIR